MAASQQVGASLEPAHDYGRRSHAAPRSGRGLRSRRHRLRRGVSGRVRGEHRSRTCRLVRSLPRSSGDRRAKRAGFVTGTRPTIGDSRCPRRSRTYVTRGGSNSHWAARCDYPDHPPGPHACRQTRSVHATLLGATPAGRGQAWEGRSALLGACERPTVPSRSDAPCRRRSPVRATPRRAL